MSSKVTMQQPSRIGDCASKPMEAGVDVQSRVKKRITLQALPSTQARSAKV